MFPWEPDSTAEVVLRKKTFMWGLSPFMSIHRKRIKPTVTGIDARCMVHKSGKLSPADTLVCTEMTAMTLNIQIVWI